MRSGTSPHPPSPTMRMGCATCAPQLQVHSASVCQGPWGLLSFRAKRTTQGCAHAGARAGWSRAMHTCLTSGRALPRALHERWPPLTPLSMRTTALPGRRQDWAASRSCTFKLLLRFAATASGAGSPRCHALFVICFPFPISMPRQEGRCASLLFPSSTYGGVQVAPRTCLVQGEAQDRWAHRQVAIWRLSDEVAHLAAVVDVLVLLPLLLLEQCGLIWAAGAQKGETGGSTCRCYPEGHQHADGAEP